MLTMIRVIRGTNTLDLPLDDSTESFYVTDVSGLGSDQNILMDDSLYIPGSNFIGASSNQRNIVLKLSHKNYRVSLSERRRELAKYFSSGSNVVLEFHSDDHPTVQTVGGIETIETELFVKEPAIVISIMCQTVPFYGMSETSYLTPFSSSATPRIINYEGTVPTGFKFDFQPFNFLIQITNMNDTSQFFNQNNVSDNTPAASWPRGRASTVYGNRYFNVFSSGGSEWSTPECLDPKSTWLQLYPGENLLRFHNPGGGVITISNLRWTPLYEGI